MSMQSDGDQQQGFDEETGVVVSADAGTVSGLGPDEELADIEFAEREDEAIEAEESEEVPDVGS